MFAMRDPSDELDDQGEPKDSGAGDKRLLIIEEEFGNALNQTKREGNTLSAILRGLWDNGNAEPLVKNNRYRVTGGHPCVIGHITGKELTMLLTENEKHNGLANRVLWVLCERKKVVPDPKPTSKAVLEDMAQALVDSRNAVLKHGVYELSLSAWEYWKNLYPLVSKDYAGTVGAVTTRAEAMIPRIALIFAVIAGHDFVEPEDLESAAAVWGYCLDSANRLFFDGGVEDPKQRKVIEALKNAPDGMTTTDIRNKVLGGHGGAKTLLETMAKDGLILRKMVTTSGRPKEVWVLKKLIKLNKPKNKHLSCEFLAQKVLIKVRGKNGGGLNEHLMSTKNDTQLTEISLNEHNELNEQGKPDDDDHIEVTI